MSPVPALRSSLFRLRHVTTPHRLVSGFGFYTRPRTTSPAASTYEALQEQNYRRLTYGARLRTDQKRERLLLGKELGSPTRLNDEMADRVHRVTMFKIADEGQRQALIEQYKVLGSTHKKDGKPYILSMVVGPAIDDPRSQGFTVVAKTEFASLEDMRFYDDECAAHGVLKSFVKEKLTVGGVMSVYFKPEAVASL
ncbi:stress responsive A/B Barrel domain-containing protein [Colletotrichum truncatum]|uniref:Stress responsive A/B Barrel domain-containing protein n=1 Tax=Colletotrichum truncatum TaxID=5467 RepID=A0ACC3Z0W3_COLTU|nr:stress responsive A/B Barrel domain-containing protein [Colletotrichum truncatum]KAF6800499.1 stress responsive A/B Barrel domain-containing protein [Colletotrichum truncatum]